MKQLLSLALAATLALTGSAQPHHHGRHHGKRAHDLDVRALEEVIVTGPTVTVYQLAGGGLISEEEAKKGIASGIYVVIGDSGNVDDGTATLKPITKPTSSGGVFKEGQAADGGSVQVKAESAPSSNKPIPSPPQKDTANDPVPPPPPPPPPPTSGMSGGSGVDAEFPSGQLSCDSFPSGYGAIPADWLGMSGWLGIQRGHANIVTGIAGHSCTPGSYCSYLCPSGYEKSQWPARQGDDNESIGGLYCNSQGKLEITRPAVKTLCQKGKGGVYVKSSLSETAFVCRTDYPGTESMLIPIEVAPGGQYPVTNPDQTWYLWDGKKTSAQYYINKSGLSRDNACTWDSPADPTGAGDKAPTNFGTGMDNGITYFGLFPNSAVSSAILNYNVRITVDGQEACSLVNGVYSGSPNGCTGAARAGQEVLIELYN